MLDKYRFMPLTTMVFTMKTIAFFVLLVCLFGDALSLPKVEVYQTGVPAGECSAEVCKAENGCRCSSGSSPLASDQVPQLISLTFDEAVTNNLYHDVWDPLLFSRVNPDGEPIGTTFFVPHEYTDYQKVNDLYNYGFEIAVHSVTKNNDQNYWRTASEQTLAQEFGGQKRIISKFANIPAEDILGVRTPQLQLAGNASIEAYVSSGLSYDSSWPTLPELPLYPYTLDYLTTQQCNLGSTCPNEAFKGFWILPINDLNGVDGQCNTVASCNITGSADEIATWLTNEINKIRSSSRAPLTLLVNSYWFEFTKNSFEGFTKFLDNLTQYKDVFLVTQKQVLDWIKSPAPLSQFQTDFPQRNANCNKYSCRYITQDNKERFLNSCVPCPATYPWLGNPEGNRQ